MRPSSTPQESRGKTTNSLYSLILPFAFTGPQHGLTIRSRMRYQLGSIMARFQRRSILIPYTSCEGVVFRVLHISSIRSTNQSPGPNPLILLSVTYIRCLFD